MDRWRFIKYRNMGYLQCACFIDYFRQNLANLLKMPLKIYKCHCHWSVANKPFSLWWFKLCNLIHLINQILFKTIVYILLSQAEDVLGFVECVISYRLFLNNNKFGDKEEKKKARASVANSFSTEIFPLLDRCQILSKVSILSRNNKTNKNK